MGFLKEKFALTPTEVRLVVRLIEGDSLRQSAAALGIAYETARTVLKSVFQKTGTCRQAELVIVIMNAMKGEDAAYRHDHKPSEQYSALWSATCDQSHTA